MTFSVMQSVYKNDNPEYLEKTFSSIYESTLRPVEIILIKDGIVSPDIDLIIKKWGTKLPFTVIGYDENKGLAHALNFGLQYVKTDLVARMDSDDYCYAERFEKQVHYFEMNSDVEICGTGLSEFYIDNKGNEQRKLRFYPPVVNSKSKCLFKGTPLGHPTAMFKTDLLKKFKYNENTNLNEDIELWFRFIRTGHVIHNIQEPLVNFRITDGTFKRRSLKKAFNEFSIYNKNLFALFGFSWRFVFPLARLFTRFMPYKINKRLYFSRARSKLLK